MKISPLPENEKERLEAIRNYHILDTEDELDFDGIVELASQLCDTPISLITLIDERRQWFKAKTGLDIKETHRNLSFCAQAIHKNDIMVVCDTLQDERFFDNPLVTGDPYIRFYAGMPLITVFWENRLFPTQHRMQHEKVLQAKVPYLIDLLRSPH